MTYSWFDNKDALKNYSSVYLTSLSRSLCLALDEFYKDLRYVFCSAYTGEGLQLIQDQLSSLINEYMEIYYQDMEESMKKLQIAKEKSIEQDKKRLNNDME